MSMYPVAERELHDRLDDQPSFFQRIALSGVDDLVLPPEVPNVDGYVELALRGGFPEIVYRERTARQRGIWLTSYIEDLITRDAQTVDVGKDPAKLRRYLDVVALNNAGMPTDAMVYRAADVNAKTAAGYDQLLQNLYVLDIVPAWATNRINRLVRVGKRYIVDTGLAAAAARLSALDVLRDNDLVGRYFDAFATAQFRPEVALMHPRPALHHLRLEAGRREVDLVVELGSGQVLGFEFKAGAAPNTDDAKHLFWLRDQLGNDFAGGAVIHTGPSIYELGNRVYAVPLCAVWA